MQRKYRLKKRKDFKRIYIRGKSYSNRELVVYIFNNYTVEEYRIGISVSKKIGNAVLRNRIKRLIKEVLHNKLKQIKIKKNIDLIIIARKPIIDMKYKDIERSIIDLLKKSDLLIKKTEINS
ncbi:MAG: ribonuclease P protein component [Vulcanibacillus sp.]